MQRRARAAACGLIGDRLVREPPDAVHPVALFGRVMQHVEKRLYAPTRGAGVAYIAIGTAIGFAAGRITPPALAVGTAVAGRDLRRTAAHVREALVANDVPAARERVRALVGRETSSLGPRDISAAVIESLAENTVDAVVAPVWWMLVGGAGMAVAYRAVNTMDAMVGHRSARYEQFGWASARVDDVANFVPARLSALLVTLVRFDRRHDVVRAVRAHAPAHPSPNAGVAEAAFAGALGVELGGPLQYGDRCEHRPRLGWGSRPVVADIDRAIALASHVEIALLALACVVIGLSRTR